MTSRSVLVVEDDPATLRALRRYFQLQGWEVRLASTVAEGLGQLAPPPECVILDLMLPDGGGEQVLSRIREDRLPVRVVICTGVHDGERLDLLARLGADVVLRKPVGIAEILRAIGEG